jgi:hypothetical protein
MRRLFCIGVAAALFGAVAASAELVDLGTITRDTDTGLDWLDLTETVGFSTNELLNDALGLMSAGWRHATADEVCAFLGAHTYPLTQWPDMQCPNGEIAVFDPDPSMLLPLMNLLGITSVFVDPDPFGTDLQLSEGLYDDEDSSSPNVGVAALVFDEIKEFGEVAHTNDFIQVAQNVIGPEVGFVGHFLVRSAALTVQIDIKPGSDPNSINLGSTGVIPVAILSTPDFDAPNEVDPDSIRLAGAAVRLIGRGDKHACHGEDVNGDELADLLCQVETVDFLVEEGESEAVLEAEKLDGRRIWGSDAVRIVPD